MVCGAVSGVRSQQLVLASREKKAGQQSRKCHVHIAVRTSQCSPWWKSAIDGGERRGASGADTVDGLQRINRMHVKWEVHDGAGSECETMRLANEGGDGAQLQDDGWRRSLTGWGLGSSGGKQGKVMGKDRLSVFACGPRHRTTRRSVGIGTRPTRRRGQAG